MSTKIDGITETVQQVAAMAATNYNEVARLRDINADLLEAAKAAAQELGALRRLIINDNESPQPYIDYGSIEESEADLSAAIAKAEGGN